MNRLMNRRAGLTLLGAAAWTLASAPLARKPRAEEPELGDLSDLKVSNPPADLPEIIFSTTDGHEHTLGEFHGHAMVVNIWATWCGPCVAEMPSLVKLSQALAPSDIAVMPLSSDRGGADVVQRFYRDHAITALPILLDPKSSAMRALGLRGIPTTLLVDRDGRERARLEGSADWSTRESIARVKSLLA